MPCLPIYFLAVGPPASQRIVYVGKNSNASPRFRTGHSAISRLHEPRYEGERKVLLLCTVTFLSSSHYVPLEWVQPLEGAQQLLTTVERQLIADFQPELNIQGKRPFRGADATVLHLEDAIGCGVFGAPDHFVYPL